MNQQNHNFMLVFAHGTYHNQDVEEQIPHQCVPMYARRTDSSLYRTGASHESNR